jgi:hypothetical protein
MGPRSDNRGYAFLGKGSYCDQASTSMVPVGSGKCVPITSLLIFNIQLLKINLHIGQPETIILARLITVLKQRGLNDHQP